MKILSSPLALAGFMLAATHSQADPLVGKWTLTGMTMAGQTITCPGALPLPPGCRIASSSSPNATAGNICY